MTYAIPARPESCARCLLDGRDYADTFDRGAIQPCSDHRGDDGQAVPYVGPYLYTPSAWILDIQRHLFRGYDQFVYRVHGYDPRYGVIIVRIGLADMMDYRMAIVSERAIGHGRTYSPLPLRDLRAFQREHPEIDLPALGVDTEPP